MAPFHAWPILFLTLPLLFWALDSVDYAFASSGPDAAGRKSPRNWRTGFGRAWAFGFGYHLIGLHWIGFSFLVQAEKFAALMPFAIVGLTAALGLFFAAAGAVYAWLHQRLPQGLPRIVLLALLIAVAEWLRGHILTGFPWNVLGYALTMPLSLAQWVGLFGIYVLTAITVISLAAPLVLLAATTMASDSPPSQTKTVLLGRTWQPWSTIVLTTIMPLVFAMVYGHWQLQTHPTAFQEGVRLRLVQPSFTQKEKFDQTKRGSIFLRHLELSTEERPAVGNAGVYRPTHIIWPEAAIPFFVRRDPNALAAVAQALPDDTQIIAGTFRINASPDLPNEQVPRNYRVFNSAIVLGGDGAVRALYDKIHLVPFGEYLPAQKLLNAIGLENLTRAKGGLASGQAPRRLMSITGLPPVEMLICYEVIFPSEIAQDEARPGVLINLTNDAWFGQTTGPYQHLHQTRLRAIEQGLPVLRSANNGISAIVDSNGRILMQLGLNRVGVIDSGLPITRKAPLYAHYGPIVEMSLFLALLTYLGALALFSVRKD